MGRGGGGESAVTKEKERRKRKSEGKGGEEKKSNGCTLSFIILVTWRSNCSTEKVHFTITFSKIRLLKYPYLFTAY